jgi:single-strand DNA-binding protein
MAGSINKVILIGNLGKDPEVRHLESGVAVCNFSIATGETYKDKNSGEKVTHTEWHNIVLWRGLAEVAEKYLKKGAKIYIEGKLRTRSWQDQEGNTRYTTEILGDNMTMLGKTVESNSLPPLPSQPGAVNKKNEESLGDEFSKPESENDDLPF